ncbi:MAG: prolyl oligopeptidase family serine peptidase, partial [candidate division Zixibacteria bacterium]|nr:prolyl oligopeptidase family serine peptidase [candidate division Zixibacteria bacterium]
GALSKPMPLPNGHIVSRERVELNRPARATVTRMYGGDVLDQTLVEQLVYVSDGLKVTGYIARPLNPGRYPVVIWNRGGSGPHGALDDLTAYLILASTAAWGYVVLATQYRGNMGSEGTEDWGGEDIRDGYHLLEVARQLPQANLERVAVEGASRGGMTTYRMLTMFPGFACAIVHAGVVDIPDLCCQKDNFARFCKELLSRFSDDERRAELERRSAVYFADQLPANVPILLLHGDADRIIPLSQSEAMAARLEELGKSHEFHVIPGGGHVALKDGSYRVIDKLRRAWLGKYLA